MNNYVINKVPNILTLAHLTFSFKPRYNDSLDGMTF